MYRERKAVMKNVQEKIGYTFKNVNLLETALTHSSYANECKKENNERLEFLGDSVLSVIISDYIFRRLPNVDEGWLSKYRATLVCEQSLNEISKKMFEVEVLVDDVPKNKGTGHSKKEAEQNAAHTLLKSMGKVQ